MRESARERNVALISNNHTDFGGDEGGGLDKYLLDELEGDGVVGEVERFPSIAAFNREHLAHVTVFHAELAARLEDETYRADVASRVSDAIVEQVSRELGPIGSIDDATNTTVTAVRIESLDLDEIGEGPRDTVYAIFHAEGEIEPEFPMLQSEAGLTTSGAFSNPSPRRVLTRRLGRLCSRRVLG